MMMSTMAVSPRPTADHAAFEQLYRLHSRSVYGFVHSRLGNADDAEDVTQTTFLNAYRSCLRGSYPQHPESWLIAIARNECRQRYRQQKRRPATERLEERTILVTAPDGEWTASDIQRALNALPEPSRRAIVMRELEGRSYAEIATELELTDSALQALLFRSRRQLREQFEETLSCAQAKRSLALRAKGELGMAGRRALRAHLRSCPDCAARERRPSRRELTVQLLLVTLPIRRVLRVLGLAGGTSSGSSAGAGAGGAIAAKAAAVVAAGVITGGVGYTIGERKPASPSRNHPKAAHVTRTHPHVGRTRSVVAHWTPRTARWIGAPASHDARGGAQPRDGAAGTHGPSTAPAPAGHSDGVTTATVQPDHAPQPAPPQGGDPAGGSASPATVPADPAAQPAAPQAAPTANPQPSADPSSPTDNQDATPTDHPTGRGKGKPDPPPPYGPPQRNLNGVPQRDDAPQPGA
jgi:RNA polymerase sigma-70 factor, ECF subfamily